MSTFQAGQIVKISVQTPVTDDGTPANDDGVARERFWVVVAYVGPDYLWGTVNNNLRYVPLDLGSVVRFHRNRVVQVNAGFTGVTTFDAEVCQCCRDNLSDGALNDLVIREHVISLLNDAAQVCQACHGEAPVDLNVA